MGTLKELLEIAERQVGIKENPPNSNNVRFNTWYYGREVSGKEYPWCMVFCQWVFDQAKVPVPVRTASCSTMLEYAKRKNTFVNRHHLQPGDLLLFNFDDPNNRIVAKHCGILKSIDGVKMKVIEGNTSIGNDCNGGMVMVRDRNINSVVGAFRPTFDEEGIDMTKKEFINSLTDEEAYILLTKGLSHINKQKEPSWSVKEGYWQEAAKKKIVDGTKPEGMVKRDELIVILGRLDLIK